MAYELKTQRTAVDPRDFIATVEHPARRQDAETLLELMREVTGEEPVMWGPSIVGFGEHSYEYASGHKGEDTKVGFSPRKANLALYSLTDAPGSEALLARLGKHRRGRSYLYLNDLADVDLEVLRELVRVGYEHRSAS